MNETYSVVGYHVRTTLFSWVTTLARAEIPERCAANYSFMTSTLRLGNRARSNLNEHRVLHFGFRWTRDVNRFAKYVMTKLGLCGEPEATEDHAAYRNFGTNAQYQDYAVASC